MCPHCGAPPEVALAAAGEAAKGAPADWLERAVRRGNSIFVYIQGEFILQMEDQIVVGVYEVGDFVLNIIEIRS